MVNSNSTYLKNELLTFLYKKKFYSISTVNRNKKHLTFYITGAFSLQRNYEKTMETLRKIANARYYFNCKEISIDFSSCTKVDIDANNMLHIILKNLNDEKSHRIEYDLFLSENNEQLNLTLLHTGVLKERETVTALNKSAEIQINRANELLKIGNIACSELFCGGISKLIHYLSDNCLLVEMGIIEKSLISFFNNCLNNKKLKMSTTGERRLKQMLTEVLDNSTQHLGKKFNQFFCNAYFENYTSDIGRGQIVIINFGQTIYEGLKYDSTSDIREILNGFSNHHQGNFNNHFTEENLWTLLSLQSKISRKYDHNIKNNRGSGTIRLIKTFQELNRESTKEATMSIISGNTQIIFDNSPFCNLNVKTIAFNKENNLEFPPEKDYIKNLKSYFPGTVLTLNFYIDNNWTQDTINIIGENDGK